jgi:hypothetical protein
MNVALEIAWDFYLDPPYDNPDKLHALGEQLMVELLKLEGCNEGVSDAGTATDAERGVVTVELVVEGTGFGQTLQKTLDVVRTAIHAVGASTPEWPTAEDLARVHLRPGGMNATPVEARDLQPA